MGRSLARAGFKNALGPVILAAIWLGLTLHAFFASFLPLQNAGRYRAFVRIDCNTAC